MSCNIPLILLKGVNKHVCLIASVRHLRLVKTQTDDAKLLMKICERRPRVYSNRSKESVFIGDEIKSLEKSTLTTEERLQEGNVCIFC